MDAVDGKGRYLTIALIGRNALTVLSDFNFQTNKDIIKLKIRPIAAVPTMEGAGGIIGRKPVDVFAAQLRSIPLSSSLNIMILECTLRRNHYV